MTSANMPCEKSKMLSEQFLKTKTKQTGNTTGKNKEIFISSNQAKVNKDLLRQLSTD